MVESDMNSIFEMDLKKLACEHINCTELIMDCVQWWFFFDEPTSSAHVGLAE